MAPEGAAPSAQSLPPSTRGRHAAWCYTKLDEGTYLWSGPNGLRLLRTPHGTSDLVNTGAPNGSTETEARTPREAPFPRPGRTGAQASDAPANDDRSSARALPGPRGQTSRRARAASSHLTNDTITNQLLLFSPDWDTRDTETLTAAARVAELTAATARNTPPRF